MSGPFLLSGHFLGWVPVSGFVTEVERGVCVCAGGRNNKVARKKKVEVFYRV